MLVPFLLLLLAYVSSETDEDELVKIHTITITTASTINTTLYSAKSVQLETCKVYYVDAGHTYHLTCNK